MAKKASRLPERPKMLTTEAVEPPAWSSPWSAATGGTDVYANARGHISEQPTQPTQPSGTENWLLNILYGVGRLGRGYLPAKC